MVPITALVLINSAGSSGKEERFNRPALIGLLLPGAGRQKLNCHRPHSLMFSTWELC